ncbi:MAG: gliding motility-associated C-terminal domain-containing protein [Saprospiraceae bacterium]|nr:gliding motility-associated C-terminal domain-containing protein [Saprospiraceae bacterium]
MLKQILLSMGFIALSSTLFSQNLLKNGDCELPTVNGKIPFWTEVQGTEWRPDNAFAAPQSGLFYFYAGGARTAELMQEVDVTDYSCPIDANRQKFDFKGFVKSFAQNPTDQTRIIVEYRSVNGTVLSTFDTGNQTNTSAWAQMTDSRIAPIGTRKIRVRLISTLKGGTDNDGYYDNIQLSPNPTLMKLDTIYNVSATCNQANGQARISVSGGILPLQFKLDNQVAVSDSILSNIKGGVHTIWVTDAANCVVSTNFSIGNTVPPSITNLKTTPSVCDRNNGTLTFVINNGTGRLTYQLGNQAARNQAKFDSLSSGNYLLRVRDSIGCTDTLTIAIGEKKKPTIDSVKVIPANCLKNNGQIIVFGSGETPNLQYGLDSSQWLNNNIFSNLKDSLYTVFIRDTNRCLFSKSIVVNKIAPPKLDSLNITPSTCAKNNGSISLYARNLTYSLDSISFSNAMQFANLQGGNYTVYIRDSAQCTISQKTIVPKIAPPVINDIQVKAETCRKNDGQIIVKASSSASSLTYSLNSIFSNRDSFQNLSSGIFTVSVRDSFNCVINQFITVSSQPQPIVEDIRTTRSVCDDATGIIVVKAKGSDLSYSLDSVHFQNDFLFRKVKAGKYRIVVKDRANCQTVITTEVMRECGLFVPTAFSPNDDGNNDRLNIFGDANLIDKILEFKVFNRWGILVFNDETVQINNINNGWDGRFRGKEVENGTYLYVVKVQLKDGTTLEEKGDVTLLR